jgi:DNA-binding NtrC family response regulator
MIEDKGLTRVIEGAATMSRQLGGGRLLVVKGPDRGESFLLGPGVLVLGSGAGTDGHLSDPTVSRRHLEAELRDDGAYVRDLGSTNGSFVQGAKFQELTLAFGAEVTIGQTVLKFVPNEEALDPKPTEEESFGELVGRDPNMRKLFRLLGDVASSEATVLLEGETGTGKELFAEEIHRRSARAAGPFIVFDCSAVPRDAGESALLGHVKDAFAGAVSNRRGALAEADGGTLFLDEVADLPPELQAVLIRALDKRSIRPVGATTAEPVSVRVLAATSRSLRAEIAARRFREDLYYRLAVVRVEVPPLRERLDDLPLLVSRFIQQFCPGRDIAVPEPVMARLRAHTFPGNVRELRNVVERACAVTRGSELEIDEASEHAAPAASVGSGPIARGTELPFKQAKSLVVEQFEREYIRNLLDRPPGHLSAAARAAEIDRKHFRELVRKHGLRAVE